MTVKNEMSQGADGADDKVDTGDVKSKPETKSTSYSGTKSSAKNKPEKKSGFLSRMILTVLLAFAVVAAYAYFYTPEKFNQYLSFDEASDSSSDQEVAGSAANQGHIPAATATTANYANNNMNPQQADWAAQQRADFEKRRAEFEKRNAANYAQQRQPTAPTEAPQWVKERQAEMEKQRAQYMKNMAEQQARWEESIKQNQMRMNPYQQHAAGNQPYNAQRPSMPYQQNMQYNPANQPPPPQYYNRPPMYNYPPNYYAPYGWQGNRYR